jgi:Family of unknown function (DUF6502)
MGAPRARPHATASDVSVAREFLERLARILVRTGHSPRELRREFQRICDELREPTRRWDTAELNYLADLPHVIACWHADPQYLDSRGAPLPLPLKDKGPSFLALIERALPEVDAAAAAKSLVRLKAVHRHKGRYLPTERYFLLTKEGGFVHALTALLGMLRTVERNLSGPRGTAILQRCAFNPSFPVRALPTFHAHAKAVAGEFIWGLDGDMRRAQEADSHGPRTRLGVGVYVFEEPFRARARHLPPKVSRAALHSRSRRRRRSGQ